jgi:hypothetical protein
MIAHLVQSYGTFHAGTHIRAADAPIAVPIAKRFVVTVLSIPLYAFFTVLAVLFLAAALRRLMGITLSPLRTVIAALIAFFAASPIITATAGAAVSSKHPGILPGLWFVVLGVVIAVLVGMLFLVISEALVPSGSLPGLRALVQVFRADPG